MSKPSSPRSKAAIERAFPSVVGLTTYDVPDDMTTGSMRFACSGKYVFHGNGIIIESEVDDADAATYSTTILAPAMLFERTNGIKPQQVEIDVCVSDGKLYKGNLVDWDFHYNLAVITIKCRSHVQPATLRSLNDVSSINIDAYESSQSHGKNPFQLGRHSNLFKVQPGTKIMIVCTNYFPPLRFEAACVVFRSLHRCYYTCKELCWIGAGTAIDSGAVINHSGEVLGIMFSGYSFLPSNIISRWWNHYKSKGKFCRPWVGVDIANLAEARLSFLEQLTNAFSGIGAGVIVTKVEKDTPAYHSGIRIKDVVVKCDGKQVQGKMEFFESMWDNAGKSVVLKVLRTSEGKELDVRLSIGETAKTNFYRWSLENLSFVATDSSSSDELSDGAP